jgi:hypothetical protein
VIEAGLLNLNISQILAKDNTNNSRFLKPSTLSKFTHVHTPFKTDTDPIIKWLAALLLQEKYAQMETHLCGTYLELLCVCSGLPNV